MRRLPPRLAAPLGVLLALLALAAAAPRPAAAAPNAFAGLVSEDAFAGSATYRQPVFRRVAATGAGTMRQTMDWATIEPVKGKFDWSRYDKFVLAAANRSIQVVPVVFNPPAWASKRPRRHAKRGTYPPKRNSQFAAFAAAAVKRYGPDGTLWADHDELPPVPIRSWQIWNEPNLPVYWQPKPRAAQYVKLLQAASTAIKAVDPGAQILTAGLPKSKLGIPLETYVRQMYAAGAADAFDALAVNPYSPTAGGVLQFLQRMRALMDSLGDTSGNLWATEIGWSDNGPGGRFRLGSKGQAKAVADAVSLLWNARTVLRLQGVVYFNWRDAKPYAGGHDFWGLHTGLLRRNGRAKPALKAFAGVVRGLQ